MYRQLFFVVIIAMLLPASARAAASIYKCVGKDGTTTFSPQPCGKDAKEVDTSGAMRTGTSPNLQGVSDRAAMADIDGRCRNRERAINDEAGRAVQEADAEMRSLNDQAAYSMNNMAGAVRTNGIRAQYSAAADRKATAVRTQSTQLSELRKQCDQERADEIKAQQERSRKAAAGP